MKVKCKVREITEKELDLEYPFFLYFQSELCEDELIKVFPKYQISVKWEVGSVKIERESYPFYGEYEIINNLTTEEHFDDAFEEALQQLVKDKAGL